LYCDKTQFRLILLLKNAQKYAMHVTNSIQRVEKYKSEMKSLKIQLGTLGSILILLGFAYPTCTNANDFQVGQRASNLMGNNAITGERINLYMVMTEMRFKRDAARNLVMNKKGKYQTEFIKNITVLSFFARSCIPCLREIPTFNRIAARYRTKPVKFLYVNVDPELTDQQIQNLINNYRIEIPVMLTNQKEAIMKYKASKLPRLVVIDRNKKITRIITGFNENLEVELSELIDLLLPQ